MSRDRGVVVHGAAAASEGWGAANCFVKILFGAGHGGSQCLSTGESGRDRRRVSATSSMRVMGLDPRRRKLVPLAAIQKHVDNVRVPLQVAALDKYRAGTHAA